MDSPMLNDVEEKMLDDTIIYHQAIANQFQKLKNYIGVNTSFFNLTPSHETLLCGRVANINCSFRNLIKLFGFPHFINCDNGSKVTVEWQFSISGMHFTIYDYCTNIIYDKYGKDLFETKMWSIGAPDMGVVKKLSKLIKDVPNIKIKE